MAQLIVNYSAIDTLTSTITSANQFFENRKDTIDTIRNGVNGVSTNRSYLGSAVSELYDKSKLFSDKESNLTTFKTELTTFASDAMEADQRVANRITTTTSIFCYTTGIGVTKTEEKSWWQSVTDFVSDGVDSVKDWYDENKDAIWAGVSLVANIAFCVLAVVAFIATLPASGFFLVCGAIAAGFALANAASDVVTSAMAFGNYVNGDKKSGDEWAKRGLKDGFLYVGRGADSGLSYIFKGYNGHVGEIISSVLYSGLSIVSAAYGVAKLGQNLLKSFKIDKLAWKNAFKFKGNKNLTWAKSVDWKSHFSKSSNWKSAAKNLLGIKKTPHGASTKYKEFKNSWAGKLAFNVGGKSSSITTLLQFKEGGTKLKAAYKTVENIFSGGNIFSEITVIKSFSNLTDSVGLTN